MALNIFDKVLKVYGFLRLPAMTARERYWFEQLLLSMKDRQPLRIFEYGSGFSTLYFANFLRRQGIAFEFHSIDNNAFWHERVKTMIAAQGLAPFVTLHLSEFEPFWQHVDWDWNRLPSQGNFRPLSSAENAYIQKPLELQGGFDLIFVDARFRRRCLELCRGRLNENGIVVLHDAEKAHYHPGTADYKYGKFYNGGGFYPGDKRKHEMWVGSMDNAQVLSLA